MIRKTRINWSGFTKLRNDGSKCIEAAMCDSCKSLIHTITKSRLERHRQICKGLSAKCGSDKLMEENIRSSTSGHSLKRTASSNDNDEDLSTNLNDEDIEVIKNVVDKKLASFFFACSVPFKIVENKYFLDLVNTLCSLNFDYKPPCRQVLASTILDEVHDDTKEEKRKLLKGTDSVLLVDGWRNKSVNRKFLVCTLRNIHISQTFLTFTDTSLEREDGDSLSKNIERAIKIAKDEYDTNVFAIVTDNDSKIVCGGRLAENRENEKLLQSTCSSHSGNLLIQSFVSEDLTNKLRDIVRTFRDPKMESLLNRLGGSNLKNFPETRFCYLRDTCETILKNLPFLQQVCLIDDVEVADDICDDIFSCEFRNKLQEIIRNLKPICKLINKCQDPSYNIADATELWLRLELPTHDYDGLIRARIQKAIWPVAYAANFLHHKYQGLSFDQHQTNIAHTFLESNLNGQSFDELQLFIADRGTFNRLSEKCCSPISFWTFCSFKLPNLAKFAIRLMLMPASTALIEGLFSNWTYVHNIYRNRLKNEKSSQLIDIYHSLKYMSLTNNTLEKRYAKSKKKHL